MNLLAKKYFDKLNLFLTGVAMGIAEVIPGVSGGTIAFISGIYEELLNTLKSINIEAFVVLKTKGILAFFKKINASFLLRLGIGMIVGLVVGVLGVSYLLENYPIYVWSFFFGLISASIIFVGKQISKWRLNEFSLFVLGAFVAYYITVATPTQGPQNLAFVFICGFIAICALMLPGVSGSFILLLMGMYEYIVGNHVKNLLTAFSLDSLIVVLVFGFGCFLGLLSFSRILSYTFKKYRNPTLALLTGFLLGSLNRVWPWKKVLLARLNSHGEIVPVQVKSVLPSNFSGDSQLLGAIFFMLLGFILLLFIEFSTKEEMAN